MAAAGMAAEMEAATAAATEAAALAAAREAAAMAAAREAAREAGVFLVATVVAREAGVFLVATVVATARGNLGLAAVAATAAAATAEVPEGDGRKSRLCQRRHRVLLARNRRCHPLRGHWPPVGEESGTRSHSRTSKAKRPIGAMGTFQVSSARTPCS